MQRLTRQPGYLYPHIERLRRDFGLELSQQSGTGQQTYSLIADLDGQYRQLTPQFSAVSDLEEYAAEHMTDILHDYLCSSSVELA